MIELDGAQHERPEQQVHDAARDFWLREHGWHILRLPNDIVIGGGDIVLARITTAIETAMVLNNV